MEYSEDLVAVSGILVNARAKFGELTKLKYKGDNKEKFQYVINSIRKFILDKQYIIENMINENARNKLNDIILFLILNTEISKQIYLDQYLQVTLNIPKISGALFANIITDLNLFNCFCGEIQKLPLKYSCEYFKEFMICLEDLNKLSQQRNGVYYIIKSIILISLNCPVEEREYLKDMLSCVPRFCILFSCITAENFSNSNSSQLYKHMGYTFWKLFDLLLMCDLQSDYMGNLINSLLSTASTIAKCLTLDIYCYWAEIDIDECTTLQRQVAEKAYLIIEKYNKFEHAKELTQLIGSFASKPRNIKEIIQVSDLDLIVKMVNKNDENQIQWFQWLIYQHSLEKTLNDEKALACIRTWSNLCTAENVAQLITVATNTKNKGMINTALSCASILPLDDLISVLVGHFFQNDFVVFKEDVSAEIIVLFNKLNESRTVQDQFLAELTLLLLKNPPKVLDFILEECLKSTFYVNILGEFFAKIADVLKCNHFCLNAAKKLMQKLPPSEENFNCYAELLNMLLKSQVLSTVEIVNEIFTEKLDKHFDQSEFQILLQYLQLLNILNISVKISDQFKVFIKLLFQILKIRTGFINHNKLHQLNVQEVINFLSKKCEIGPQDLSTIIEENTDDGFILYYQKMFLWPISQKSFLHYVAPEFNLNNDEKAACWMLKVLPSCVSSEWKIISNEIISMSSWQKMLQIIKDTLVFLAEFMKSSKEALTNSYIYCLQEYEIVIKDILSIRNTTTQDEIIITNLVVELLCHLSEDIKQKEGIKIITLMTDRSLKALNKEKQFVCRLCMIKEKTLCQIIAQKMLP